MIEYILICVISLILTVIFFKLRFGNDWDNIVDDYITADTVLIIIFATIFVPILWITILVNISYIIRDYIDTNIEKIKDILK